MAPMSAPSSSPFARAAVELLELGYRIVPIMARNKAPGEYRAGKWGLMHEWPKFRDRPPSQFELGVWKRWPDANLGIVLGNHIGHHQVVAFDVDVADTGAIAAIRGALPVSTMDKHGEKGATMFFRAPRELLNRTYNVGGERYLDVLTGNKTRQTVVPPSIHPRGLAYEWITGPVRAADLPIIAAEHMVAMESVLREMGWDPEDRRPAREFRHDSEPTIWRETNDAALTNFAAWVPALDLPKCRRTQHGYEAVAWWRPSSSGKPLADRKPNLKFHPDGIKDFGADQGYAALDVIMPAMSWDLDTAFAWLRGRLGIDAPPIELTHSPRIEITGEGDAIDAKTGDVIEEAKPASAQSPFLWAVPGLVGEVADWICATARKPNRPLAIGAALCLVGTMAGRKFAGPTRSATHLYLLGLGTTGIGKDHPRQQLMRLMKAAKAAHHLGPDEFISMPAIVNAVQRQPLMLAIMDEIGAWFARINNPKKSSGFEGSISKIMRTLWGTSFGIYMTPEWAGRQAMAISWPAMSICGFSTPREFFASMQSGDVINGMMNRFLLIEAAPKVSEQEPSLPPADVPADLCQKLWDVYSALGDLPTATMNRADEPPAREPIVLKWGIDAEVRYRALVTECEGRIDRDGDDAPFLARTAEIAVRLATIRAVGCGQRAVKLEDMDWGAALALHSAARMHALTKDYLAENDHQASLFMVRRIIADAKPAISRRDLLRKLNGKLKSRDLDEIIKNLRETGELIEKRIIPSGGGTPTVSYRID